VGSSLDKYSYNTIEMNTLKVLALVAIMAFASLGLAAIAQTPSATSTAGTTSTSSDLNQSFIGKITEAVRSDVTGTASISYPYYYYYGSFYPVDNIMQILSNADDAQYKGLSIGTVNGVTTIKADEITATSSTDSLHAVSLKVVIDKNTGIASLTASSLDFKNSQSSFSGKSVSFTYQYYYMAVPMKSDGTIPPTATK